MKSGIVVYLLTSVFLLCKCATIMSTRNAGLFKKIAATKLAVSEPNPAWFGNPANEANNPNWTNKNWLKSRFHFSFAEYSNPRNTGFGVLRVMNDDLVQPNRGFGEHPHSNMEICTYVVHGKLTHKDSMGTQETLERGAIQFMTAGTGVTHGEHNLDKTEPLRFIQMWINPRKRNLPPNYGSTSMNTAMDVSEVDNSCSARQNVWTHLVSDVEDKKRSTPIKINQDANIHVTEVLPGNQVEFPLQEGRQAYVLCVEGIARFAGVHGEEVLEQHDAAEVYGPNTFTVSAGDGAASAHVLLVEMAYTGVGRSDL